MAIEYQTTTYRTCEGTGDGSGLWIEISLWHTHNLVGTLKRVTIPVRRSGVPDGVPPTYLAIYLEQANGTWERVAVSKNACVPVASGEYIWNYDGIILNGRRIRFIPLTSPKEVESPSLSLHYRFNMSTDGSQIKYGTTTYQQIVDMTITIENAHFVPDEGEQPDTEVKLRQIDISNYWPSVVGETDEFQQIAEAENPEFNTLQACIYRVLQDSFVHDATDYGVRRWESILGISPAAGDTLDNRKARILTYLNIKLPYTWRILKQMLTDYLDENQFTLEYINDEGKLVLHTDRISDDKLETINTLLEKVIPQNIEVDLQRDYGFTYIEYLENPVRGNIPFIALACNFDAVTDTAEIETTNLMFESSRNNYGTEGAYISTEGVTWAWGVTVVNNVYKPSFGLGRQRYDDTFIRSDTVGLDDYIIYKSTVNNGTMTGWLNGVQVGTVTKQATSIRFTTMWLFAAHGQQHPTFNYFRGRKKNFKLSINGELKYDMLPCLDETGAPCMYDRVSKSAFYNSGTGDFLYPTDAAPAVSADLDEKFYAKLTATGVRRLYHVPEGCNMTKDEYAAANGFKELVEPPMPLEGYWEPQWRETDTQLILDWVETEPPAEPEPMEVIENE